MSFRVAIIGAGAAGMMCTAAIAEQSPHAEIVLFDRNDGLGKKVIISGGGRCNVTTGIHDVKTVLTKYPRGNKFLTSAMYAFPPEAVYGWFERHGVPLKTQEDARVFPNSDDGKDIVRVFENIFSSSHVDVRLKTAITHIEKRNDVFLIFTKNSPIPQEANILVLTTGGQAYRQTGSVGDGYAFAGALGHTITPLAPSLNAFFTKETWPAHISGLSFHNARITAVQSKKHFTGPFLFTHKGISGPAVFALSSLVAFEIYNVEHPLEIAIDLFPDTSLEQLCEQLFTLTKKHPKKLFENVLGMMIPQSLVDVIAGLTRNPSNQETMDPGSVSGMTSNTVSKKEIHRICTWIKNIPLSVIQRGAGDEFVTAGGVSLAEVDPRSMESTLCPNLFFAGEILDIDGFTGGFNLQASWATGKLAGEHIARAILNTNNY